jgi:ATP-binding protein involved in chromosome partitioning
MAIAQEQVLAALRTVRDPELFKDIVLLNMVKGVQLDGPTVRVRLDAGPSATPATREAIGRQSTAALKAAGAERVEIEFAGVAPPGGGGGAAGVLGGTRPRPASALPQVKHVIAVGAGKGGVGKSTLALNLAVGLHRGGARVGVMDGDIYGPSMPTLLGIKGLAPQVRNGKILPFSVHGISAITIGALVEQDKPLIWRGPMAHGAFKQLLVDNTDWPELDYLIVDLPPGTGDVPLTLCQLLPLAGAVVVATPQQVALDDAVRAIRMFQQLEAPVLGMVENMSYVPLPGGGTLDLFGRGGTERAAREMGLPFLGAIPMFPELRQNSDAGTPIKNFEGDPALRSSLETIVTNLVAEVVRRQTMGDGPQLTIS